MYKLFIIVLFSCSLFADGNRVLKTDELFKYSSVPINESISIYAAEIYMNNLEDENRYSVGFLLNTETINDAEFGIGYMKVGIDTMVLLSSIKPLGIEVNDGLLFFMNYKF